MDAERTEIEEITKKVKSVRLESRGDAIRDTWFLTNSFKGRDLEKEVIKYVISHFIAPNLPHSDADIREFTIPFTVLPDSLCASEGGKRVRNEEKQTILEKSIYRLYLIGAIADYMKDYSSKRFEIKLQYRTPSEIKNRYQDYLRRYITERQAQTYIPETTCETYQDAASGYAQALIDFVYETIAKRRRRVIGQMLQTARDAVTGGSQVFRQQLLDYLEESEYTQPVVEIAKGDDPSMWFKVLSKVEGMDGVSKLLGACRRQLEESPDHPGLLLLAGLCRLASPSTQQAHQDIRNGFIALKKNYLDEIERLQITKKFISETERLCPTKIEVVLKALLEADSSSELVHYAYVKAQPWNEVHYSSLIHIMNGIFASIQGVGEKL